MSQGDDELRAEIGQAVSDETAGLARVVAARSLAAAMRDAGHTLWHAGYFIGPDRVNGSSPFEFGSDVTVGIATAFQVGGEVVSGTASLLEVGNRYAAMALVRQLVEVEYVGWAFAEDQSRTGADWLRSTRSERLKMWQPRHLRDSSDGRFRARDYESHCELGGHPTPTAGRLLPDHAKQMQEGWIWFELCCHGQSAWDYLAAAVAAQRHADLVGELASVKSLIQAWRAWETADPLIRLVDQARTQAGLN